MAVKQKIDLGGNVLVTSAVVVGADKAGVPSTGTIGIYTGAGAPTFSAAKGSLYSNTTGSSTATRLYVNTDGATTWTNATTAA